MPTEYGDRAAAINGQILRTVVGSGVHGVAIAGTDDHDEMAIYVPPARQMLGATSHREDYIYRTRSEGERSGPGDTDVVAYSLRKYLRLAIVGNPTALLPLFAPTRDVLAVNQLGHELRRMRHGFLTQSAVHRFLGYMQSQKQRMLGQDKKNVPNRPELIARHGWDTKYGSHALRLAYQGHEIADTGDLTLPLREPQRLRVLAVKQGHVRRSDVAEEIENLQAATRSILNNGSSLPATANRSTIDAWSTRAHLEGWGCG